jgi:oligoendopeptidase F
MAESDPLASYQADLTRYFPDSAQEEAARAGLAARGKSFTSASNWGVKEAAKHLSEGASLLTEWMRHAVYCRVRAARDTGDKAAKLCQAQSYEAVDSVTAYVDGQLRAPLFAKMSAADQQRLGLAPYRGLIAKAQDAARHEPEPAARAAIAALADPMLQGLYDRYEKVADGLKTLDDYAAHKELFAATLIDVVREETALAKLHHYNSAPAWKYAERLGITEAMARDLLDRMSQSGQVLKDYQSVRVPHGFTPEPMEIGAVRATILKALAPLGPDYSGQFAWLMDPANGAIDLAGGGTRYRGGFSQGFPGVPVMLYVGGFDGSFAKMSTIIHEGGHALHRKFMGGVSPYAAEAPKFVAEATAIFNELLLLDERERDSNSPAERIYYQEKFLDKLSHEIFTSAEEGLLEQGLYEGVAAGTITDSAGIDALNGAILNRFAVDGASQAGNWMKKDLLYEDPLYLLNYLYAALVACRFHAMSEADPEGFRTRYLALLKQGYDTPSDEALRRTMGFGLDAVPLLDDALRLMSERTKKLEAAYLSLPKEKP